jgi:hypothetical protein
VISSLSVLTTDGSSFLSDLNLRIYSVVALLLPVDLSIFLLETDDVTWLVFVVLLTICSDMVDYFLSLSPTALATLLICLG